MWEGVDKLFLLFDPSNFGDSVVKTGDHLGEYTSSTFIGCQLPPKDIIEVHKAAEKRPRNSRSDVQVQENSLENDYSEEIQSDVRDNSLEMDDSEEMEHIYFGNDDSQSKSDNSDSDFEIWK